MMAAELRDRERTMRRAGWIAAGISSLFYVGATVALLVILSPDKISELNGFVEAGDSAGKLLGATWLSSLIDSGDRQRSGVRRRKWNRFVAIALFRGVDGLLPKAFARLHPKWNTPYISTLALALVSTFLLVIYQLGDTMRVAYVELVSLMVITSFVPYIYIFASAWKAGKRLSACSGMIVTLLALLCSVIPPTEIEKVWLYESKLIAGTLAVMIAAWAVYRGRLRYH